MLGHAIQAGTCGRSVLTTASRQVVLGTRTAAVGVSAEFEVVAGHYQIDVAEGPFYPIYPKTALRPNFSSS